MTNGTAAPSVTRKPLKNPSFPTWQEQINLSAIPLPNSGSAQEWIRLHADILFVSTNPKCGKKIQFAGAIWNHLRRNRAKTGPKEACSAISSQAAGQSSPQGFDASFAGPYSSPAFSSLPKAVHSSVDAGGHY
ncbi:hypothetical protein [Mesorhizobium sp. M0276]|uniref:hypothetical protein n=1 Tax=Mesorhizobium sp. M0276 TaxID=2956928 RepID=UPI003335BC60